MGQGPFRGPLSASFLSPTVALGFHCQTAPCVLSSHSVPGWTRDLLCPFTGIDFTHLCLPHSRTAEQLSSQRVVVLNLVLRGFQGPTWSSHLILELPVCS